MKTSDKINGIEIIGILIIGMFFIIGGVLAVPTASIDKLGSELIPGGVDVTACETYADCVPKQCCHPTSCINKKYKEDCGSGICTLSCEGPIDCGAGSCKCVNNKCKVVSSDQQNSGVVSDQKPIISKCPENCNCLTDAEANNNNLKKCNGQTIPCKIPSTGSSGSIDGHCYEKPLKCTGINCSCYASNPGSGYTSCDQKCTLANGATGECWKKSLTPLKCTGINCSCYASNPGSGYTSCDQKCTLANGATGECWKKTVSSNVTAVMK